MEQGVDAIILAGTNKYRWLEEIGEDCKPFIEIGGRTLVEYVIDAALECPDISRTYVVTDVERLEALLAKRRFDVPDKLKIVPQHDSFLGNIRYPFLYDVLPDAGFSRIEKGETPEQYVKRNPEATEQKVVGLYSDSPFIRGIDISRFIETSEESYPEADYVIGFAYDKPIREIEEHLDRELCTPETKSALFFLDGTMTRANNLLYGKPLKLPHEVWDIAQNVYDNRKFLDEQGGHRIKKWLSQAKTPFKYVMIHPSKRPTITWGFLTGVYHFLMFGLANLTKSQVPYVLSKKEERERVVYRMSGNKAVARINICDVTLPTFDIDNPRFLSMLRENDCELFYKLQTCPRNYPFESDEQFEKLQDYLRWCVRGHDEVLSF
ncbi:nucleotidyltransferase family protein [Candidatus Woesearchaeota archaeon]|nr:nucleotidyltransferase family protein [Candidatus Woesearchaeota archaeon]